MDKEVEAATSVDVLIERLSTHPEEFFNKQSVVTYDGDKIFAGTKWRRIVVTLMVDQKPGEANLWMNLFSGAEKDRFRIAMYAALRSELDGQIMMALMQGSALPMDREEQEVYYKAQALQSQMAKYQSAQARYAQGSLGSLAGAAAGAQTIPPPSASKTSKGGSLQQYLTDWMEGKL